MQLAERIRQRFNLANKRARAIAMTEVGASVEEARAEGRKQANVPLKSWLSSRKETGRQEHSATERITMEEPIQQNELFTIAGTGATAPHPRASGRPDQDINCGCTTLARYPDDSLKSVISRYQQNGFLSYEQLQRRDAKRRDGKGAEA